MSNLLRSLYIKLGFFFCANSRVYFATEKRNTKIMDSGKDLVFTWILVFLKVIPRRLVCPIL